MARALARSHPVSLAHATSPVPTARAISLPRSASRVAVKHLAPQNPWLPLLTPHQLVEINAAFKKFDRDGDGHIEPHEIKTVMANLGCPQTAEQVQKLIATVDTDGNGMVSHQHQQHYRPPPLRLGGRGRRVGATLPAPLRRAGTLR